MKNILIISSDYTGHGHKSIAEALSEFFSQHDEIKVTVVDGFSLGGRALLRIGKSYGPITRRAKDLWKFIWDISSIKPSIINELIAHLIKDNLLKLIDEVRPDLILSIHPNFNGSVIDIMESNNIHIPFMTLIADLVSIYPLWSDPRADYIISPTEEGREKCLEYGVDESKIKVLGFPVRSRFNCILKKNQEATVNIEDKPFTCLIMSGGEGVGNMSTIARILLDNFNCTVKIIAGRNTALKKRLQNSLSGNYNDRVEIYGFTKNVQDLMMASDIAFTRGSPNVMMEAISCNIPLVVTGALPGQEEGNPGFIEKYNLGVVCNDTKDLKETMTSLLSDNCKKLNEIRKSQKDYYNTNPAKEIVDFILSTFSDK